MAGRPAILKVDIVADAKGAKKGAAEAEGRFSKLGGTLGKVGKVAAVGGAAVAAAAAGMAVASAKSASDLEQSMGAVETVFGKSAKTVKKYADSSAKRLGLAKSQYATLAAAVGTSMGNMGKSQAEAAGLTDKLIGRAADLAATFGGTTEEATQALGAAFRGEFDSVERLGISLKASDISARLAAKGQDKLKGQALKNAQGQATLDLIMQQTAKTAGAFGRESDTLAHQQQVLGAQFEDVKAKIGAKFIPILVKLAQWFQRSVVPAVGRLVATLRTQLSPTIASVASWVSTRLVPVLRAWATYILRNVVPVIRSTLVPIIQGLRSAFASVASAVSRNSGQFAKLKPIIDGVVKVAKVAAPIIGTVLKKAFQIVGGAIGKVIDVIGGVIGVIDTVIRKFDDLWRKVTDVVGGIRDKVDAIGGVISKLPGLSAEVTVVGPELATIGPRLTGPGYRSPDLGPIATFAAGSGGVGYGVLGGSLGTSRRDAVAASIVNVTVNGALDPPAVARQIGELLRSHDVRLGRTPAFAGWLGG